jgi:hypothetical protein
MVAESVYVIIKPVCAIFDIPVMSAAAVVDIVTAGREVAPVGAARVTLSVSPVGMVVSKAPVILLAVLFVVKEYVVELSEAFVGGFPATADPIVSIPGLPETEIASIELIV